MVVGHLVSMEYTITHIRSGKVTRHRKLLVFNIVNKLSDESHCTVSFVSRDGNSDLQWFDNYFTEMGIKVEVIEEFISDNIHTQTVRFSTT